jgi:hypothetical protein
MIGNPGRRALGRAVCWVAAVASLGMISAAARASERPTNPHEVKAKLQKYESDYYTIFTDLDIEVVREAAARLRAMAEEYNRRTKGFAGTMTKKFPFYLFSNSPDYYAAGGPKDSSGVYTGGSLMAAAPKGSPNDRVWHVVQHEGFHQFAHVVISSRLPVWVSEGLAEYFGEGIWTGDGIVTGVMPSSKLDRVQKSIKENQVLPFQEMVGINQKDWNDKVGTPDGTRNYEQAWAMVHFLVHAEDGKYRKEFSGFMVDVSRGKSARQAFADRFGGDMQAFEKRYRDWWASMGENPTADAHTQATVATLTSFLARGTAMGLKFQNAEDFFAAAKDGKLDVDPKKNPRLTYLWLPPSLLTKTLPKAGALGEWSLQLPEKGTPKLLLKQAGGKTFTGTFALPPGKSPEVSVTMEAPKPATLPAAQP